MAALAIGALAVLSVKYGLAKNYSIVIIGSVMPLVPGVPLTNAVRDLLAGHILSGIARATEALLTAVAIGMGIACVFTLLFRKEDQDGSNNDRDSRYFQLSSYGRLCGHPEHSAFSFERLWLDRNFGLDDI